MSSNKYKKIEEIESDDYGKIEKVMNNEDGSFSLMRILNKKYLKSKIESETLNELEKLASLSHQNLSKIKEYFFTENTFNIIMEYDEDSEFKNKIKYNVDNHLSFEENYIWSLTIQLLNILKFIQ